MRVLHFITDLDPGGAERMLQRTVVTLAKAGVEQRVVNLRRPGTVQDEIERSGIPVRALGLGFPPPLAGAYAALRDAGKWRPDICHGWMYHGCVAASGFTRLFSPQTITVWGIRYTLTDLRSTKWSTRTLIRVLARLSKSADAIVYNSRVGADHHEAAGYDRSRTTVIPNGIDTTAWRRRDDERRRVRAEWGVGSHPVIGMVGRYDPDKGPMNFLDAAAKLRAPDVRFVLAGPGYSESNKKLREAIERRGLRNRTILLGVRDDRRAVTSGFDVATNSSRSESFSNAILEALACEVPVVATRVGDAETLVGRGGIVVEPMDSGALSDAWRDLLRMSDDERRAVGEKGRKSVDERFQIETVTGLYRSLYERLAAENTATS